MRHMGSYFDEPGAEPEEYATAGVGIVPFPQHVDPGIDISHYGAPYKQMLGLGQVPFPQHVDPGIDISHYGAPYKQMLGLGATGEMLYRYQGMGYEGLGEWSPGPGQSPADDPRMVKKFSSIKSTYRVRNVPSGKAQSAVTLLLAQARASFPGMTVRKIGTTGWTRDGRVGFTVILRRPTRAGEIKHKLFLIGRNVGPRIGTNTSLYDARTTIRVQDYLAAPAPTIDPSEFEAAPEAPEGPFLTRRVAGLPVWALGIVGVGILGGVGLMLRKPKAVAANRRRRRRRRR